MSNLSSKLVPVLAGVTLIAMAASTFMSISRRPVTDSAKSHGYALPDLRDHINDVKGVTVLVADEKPAVTLERTDRGWSVKEKGGYRADTGQLRELLLKLADARLLEVKTSVEQRYAELGVEDVKAKDAKGVKLALEGLAKPTRLIVGNFSTKANGTFVRRPDEKQSWLAQGNLQVERDPLQWIDKNLADISAERIAEVVLMRAGGKPLRLFKEKPEESVFRIADLPKGREANPQSGLNSLASTLSGFTMVDVQPANAAQEAGKKGALAARYRTFDGLTVDVDAWKQDDKYLARLSATLDQRLAEARIRTLQSTAQKTAEATSKEGSQRSAEAATPKGAPAADKADADKERQSRMEELEAEAQRLNQAFTGWQFFISSDKYANMDKAMEDVSKPITEKKTSTPTQSPPKDAAGKAKR